MTILHQALDAETHLVTLNQALTSSQAETLEASLRAVARQGAKRVILDLSDVALIDSRGLSALVAGYRLFGSQADNILLCGLQAQPQLLFELTGFDMIFQIYDSLADLSIWESEPLLPLAVDIPEFGLELAMVDLAA